MSDSEMWRILSGEKQRYDQEYENFRKRNPAPKPRPIWQQIGILAVPVLILFGMVWIVL
jgi:hypothetical protein